jgi:hypothetical protein
MAMVSFGIIVHPMPKLAITVISVIYQKYIQKIIADRI